MVEVTVAPDQPAAFMADEVLGSRAIVTGENQRVLAQPELIDAIEELAHMLISACIISA